MIIVVIFTVFTILFFWLGYYLGQHNAMVEYLETLEKEIENNEI